ncbi:unnamed protein product [Acanthoscelides obtectus]|uniref:Uncharacterized protein n=1 Tax=Acanthoscelides obtectus TaxID=200917 RepID=A0A9P0PFM8_ACAOB|nr:unnamed protein product [Acanthoscelides obtectus]CAK1675120.1 hypothetical protein AOBTE_LOCUS29921 [Acanthoscelides obtectus]
MFALAVVIYSYMCCKKVKNYTFEYCCSFDNRCSVAFILDAAFFCDKFSYLKYCYFSWEISKNKLPATLGTPSCAATCAAHEAVSYENAEAGEAYDTAGICNKRKYNDKKSSIFRAKLAYSFTLNKNI